MIQRQTIREKCAWVKSNTWRDERPVATGLDRFFRFFDFSTNISTGNRKNSEFVQLQLVVRSFAVGFSPISVFFPVQWTGPANTSKVEWWLSWRKLEWWPCGTHRYLCGHSMASSESATYDKQDPNSVWNLFGSCFACPMFWIYLGLVYHRLHHWVLTHVLMCSTMSSLRFPSTYHCSALPTFGRHVINFLVPYKIINVIIGTLLCLCTAF